MDIKRLKCNVSLLGESMVGKTCMVSNLKGFEFDSNKITHIMAVIDTPEHPGYLTLAS